ncbi:hypothetical protein ABT255_58225 [Streptomyces mirabilis]|uniref:hypothetical protein n=1 Tax=Streptomyces mirabilis TaxID=68239 RepID=UPI0033216F7C
MSMATWRILFRQVSGVVASQARTSATVRPSTWPSSPAGAEGVDEAGVRPVPHQVPLAGLGVLLPLRLAPPGLVDAQHLDPKAPHSGQARLGGAPRPAP